MADVEAPAQENGDQAVKIKDSPSKIVEDNTGEEKKDEMKEVKNEDEKKEVKNEDEEKEVKKEESPENGADAASEAPKEEVKKEIVMTPELERKIIRQIEFYFGDLNLARDRFMQSEIKENDGWLTMETMMKFNRLRNLCDDPVKIVEAAKKSSSGLLEFSEDGQKVRRSPSKPVPSNTEERRADLKARTCYAKNFPEGSTMGDLLDFFDLHCSTELIQMRRNAKKEFKGSVFIVFPTKEEAKKFLDLKDLKVGDCEPLVKMLKEDYFQEKDLKRKEWKGKTEVKEDPEVAKKKEAALKEEDKLIRDKMTKGAILHLVGISSDTTREDLKEAFGSVGDDGKVAWVDHEKGDSDAWLRFNEENGAQKAWDEYGKDGIIMIKDCQVRADVLEGEVEFNHWKNIFQSRADRSSRRGGSGGRGRGRGRGRGKGRRGGHDDGGPPSKRSRRY